MDAPVKPEHDGTWGTPTLPPTASPSGSTGGSMGGCGKPKGCVDAPVKPEHDGTWGTAHTPTYSVPYSGASRPGSTRGSGKATGGAAQSVLSAAKPFDIGMGARWPSLLEK